MFNTKLALSLNTQTLAISNELYQPIRTHQLILSQIETELEITAQFGSETRSRHARTFTVLSHIKRFYYSKRPYITHTKGRGGHIVIFYIRDPHIVKLVGDSTSIFHRETRPHMANNLCTFHRFISLRYVRRLSCIRFTRVVLMLDVARGRLG